MLKRFLFIFLLFGFVISIPYEISAAPKKETRQERRERLKREREERKRQQTQPKPAEKKIIPTLSNGKMNGIYREYDTQGVQTIELPVVNDKPNGNGWILETVFVHIKSFITTLS